MIPLDPDRFESIADRGYATDCVQVLFAHLLARNIRPLWRIGGRQKVAIYFAEKLEMDEIGVDGQEVYLQACLNRAPAGAKG